MANTINWGSMRNDMVNGLAFSEEQLSSPTVTYASGLGLAEPKNSQLNLEDVEPQRKRRSPLVTGGLMLADLFEISSGDKNAYVGRNLERAAQIEKLRAEEDPEGYQADLNRAKMLSRKAAASNDESVKAQYGQAIKKLFPTQTQGLDDVTASELFMSDNDKLQLEMLKGENALRKQMLVNQGRLANTGLSNAGKLEVANVNNMSREQIAQLNNDTRREIAVMQAEARRAIADGNNARALEIAGMVDQRMRDLAVINGEYKLANTGMQNENRLEVQRVKNIAEMEQMLQDQYGDQQLQILKDAGALSREQLKADTRLSVAQINANARKEAAQIGVKEATPIAGLRGGVLRPSQGVIDSLALIKKNPGVFSATSSLLDTKIGRATGALSSKSVALRTSVEQSLNSLTRESVQALMAMFPKGGTGVINTGVEQKLFIPVAQAIASGEGSQIIPAVEAYYGNLYDEAAKYGEDAPMSRSDFVRYMTTGEAPAGFVMPRQQAGGTVPNTTPAPATPATATPAPAPTANTPYTITSAGDLAF